MKSISFFYILFQIATIAFSQDSTYIKEHYDKYEYMIPMRDGVKLFTAVFVPKDKSKKYPILLNRTPYSCSPYGEDKFPDRLAPAPGKKYLEEGFIFVKQDVRGRFMSQGEFENVRPFIPDKKNNQIDEASDTYDTVDWLLKKLDEDNGKVGVYGISYPGFYSSMAALSFHPSIKAVSPQAPVTNWFLGDDEFHNGAYFLFDFFGFTYVIDRPRPKPTTEWPNRFDYKTPDAYKFFLELGPLSNIDKHYYHDSIPYWKEVMAHPNYDEYWKARDIRQHLKNIQCATLVTGGLFDAEDCWGTFETYKWIERQNPQIKNYLVMGPWFHGGWARSDGDFFGDMKFSMKTSLYYRDSIEFPFFMHYLKDAPAAVLPEATVFDAGADMFRKFDEWPPKEAKQKKYFLRDDGKISSAPSEANNSYDEYISDPQKPVPFTNEIRNDRSREYMIEDQRFASRRTDVLVYQTEILEKNLTVAGPVFADLYVSTTGTDADFIVKVIDVFPDTLPDEQLNGKEVKIGGYQMLVRAEVMRARFRNSFENPESMIPEKIEHIRFSMPDVMHTFQKGHRLMAQLQSTWFPLVARNPQQFVNIFTATEKDYIKATHRIFHQQNAVSAIEVMEME